MKKVLFFAVPFALVLMLSSAASADDNAGEWSGAVGCAKCDYAKDTSATVCGAAIKVGDKVYTLTGAAVTKEFPKGCTAKTGNYTVKGKISADGKSIEVTELAKKA